MDAQTRILDHIGLTVASIERSSAFYDKALAPLGIAPVMRFETYVGYGIGRPTFWIGQGDGAPRPAKPGVHVALVARDRATVRAFHAAALAAGGTDNGGPGLRPHYHPDYYGAFVLDLDGHNIEAVCHLPA